MTPPRMPLLPGVARLPHCRPAARHRPDPLTWLGLAWLCLAWLVLPAPVRAGQVPGELPAFVGRLSSLQGDVRWYDRDSAAWLGSPEQPLRNWPITAGDRLRTGPGARAELRVGGSTLRLGADVDLTLQQLDEQRLTLWLQSGTVALRLAKPLPGDVTMVELLSPEGRWVPMRPGHYRLERQPEARTPATQATVWRGELRFEGPDSVLVIPPGRRADLWQDRFSGATRYAWAPVDRDDFADWVARDERQDDAPVSARHVPPGMSGWQDLDRHGDWVNHPELGSVWQPRVVAPGWAPFHDGRWAWVAPWGWTWIDAAPWGFAPFHYGSWLVFGGRWCWSPGPRHVRPRFAPALSGWVSGPQLGIGIQIGGGQRPPPPRVVMPVSPPPVVVVLPPRGHEHRPPPPYPRAGDRPDGWPGHDRGRPPPGPGGPHPGDGRAWGPGEGRDRPGHHDRDDGRDRPGRRESDEGRDRPGRRDGSDGPWRGERPEGPPRGDRPDRQHGAERVNRLAPVPAAGLPATGPVPVAAAPAAGPVPALAPVPPAAPLRPAPPPAMPRAEPVPAPAVAPPGEAQGRPGWGGRPAREERSERPERPERGDAEGRSGRRDPQAVR